MATLTASQRRRWERSRAKGRTRIMVEQFLAWTSIAAGGPTLRAYLRRGLDGAEAYWSGSAAAAHAVIAILVGAVMSYIFGAVAWERMERLYRKASSNDTSARTAGTTGTTRPSGP